MTWEIGTGAVEISVFSLINASFIVLFLHDTRFLAIIGEDEETSVAIVCTS